MGEMQYPSSERQRPLQSLAFSESNILTRELNKDTVLKGIQFRLNGAVQTTFGSGTPVADSLSTFDNIITRIDIVVGGNRTVKSVRPFLLRMQQLFTTTVLSERRSSAAASAAAQTTVDAGFTYGTTTQYTTVAETIYLPFEHVYCEPGFGREKTWLNLKGVSSAEIRLTTAAFSKLLGFGNTAPVTYGNSTLNIDIVTIEAQEVPANVVFADWKQTTKEQSFSAETTDYPIEINKGNELSGIMIFARDGAAGSATTATGKLPSNLALTKLDLKVNGQSSIKATTFQQLQAENRNRYGFSAPMASNVSLVDGVAHLNLLARKDISTALPCYAPAIDLVQLFVNTNTASNVSYTNPVSVTLMTEEIVMPR